MVMSLIRSSQCSANEVHEYLLRNMFSIYNPSQLLEETKSFFNAVSTYSSNFQKIQAKPGFTYQAHQLL